MSEEEGSNQTNDDKIVRSLKLYLKDVSFESPYDQSKPTSQWDPTLNIELDNRATQLAEDTYNVIFRITATALNGDTTAFLAEVQQGGIFRIKGFDPEALQRVLNVHCARTLYPYACATIDDLVVKGGFPPLRLSPINFLARYKKSLGQAGPASDDEETGV